MTAKPAITLENVGFAYRPGQWVFRKCSAEIAQGQVVAVLGANGRGKTTLLKILIEALHAVEGTVAINGSIAFVPQIFEMSFDYSVLDIVLMGRAKTIGLFSQPSDDDRAHAFAALETFGLATYASTPFHQLSGGQRQLTLCARAIVADARILILDEPTASLDLKNQALVLQTVRRLAKQDGLTIVFSTHHPNHALAFADDALLMIDVQEQKFGPALDVLAETELSRIFEHPIRRLDVPGFRRPIIAPVFQSIE